MFDTWSLRAKLALLLVVLTFAASLIPASIFYTQLAQAMTAGSKDQLERDLDLQAIELEHATEALRQDVAFLASTPPVAGIPRALAAGGLDPYDGSPLDVWKARLEEIFRSLLESRSIYDQARFIQLGEAGRELVRVDRYGPNESLRHVRGEALQAKATTRYAKQAAMLGGREVYLSPIELNREQGRIALPHSPVLRAAISTVDGDGNTFGIIVINASVERIFERLARLRDPAHRYLVTNAKGQLIDHPDRTKTFQFEFGDPSNVFPTVPELSDLLDPRSAASERRSSRSTIVAANRVTSVRRVGYDPNDPTAQLGLVVEADLADVLVLARQSALKTLFRASALVALVLIGVLLLSSRLLAPIHQLAQDMPRVHLDDDSAIPIPRSLEAKRLAETFQRTFGRLRVTTSDLRRKNREIETLGRIVDRDVRQFASSVRSELAMLLVDPGKDTDRKVIDTLERLEHRSEQMLQLVQSLESSAQAAPPDDPESTSS